MAYTEKDLTQPYTDSDLELARRIIKAIRWIKTTEDAADFIAKNLAAERDRAIKSALVQRAYERTALVSRRIGRRTCGTRKIKPGSPVAP
jgi:hypothetical protein